MHSLLQSVPHTQPRLGVTDVVTWNTRWPVYSIQVNVILYRELLTLSFLHTER